MNPKYALIIGKSTTARPQLNQFDTWVYCNYTFEPIVGMNNGTEGIKNVPLNAINEIIPATTIQKPF